VLAPERGQEREPHDRREETHEDAVCHRRRDRDADAPVGERHPRLDEPLVERGGESGAQRAVDVPARGEEGGHEQQQPRDDAEFALHPAEDDAREQPADGAHREDRQRLAVRLHHHLADGHSTGASGAWSKNAATPASVPSSVAMRVSTARYTRIQPAHRHRTRRGVGAEVGPTETG